MHHRLIAAVVLSVLLPSAAAGAPGCRVYDAEEVLQTRIVAEGSALQFVAPNGRHWPLVPTTSDPAISNPGSGQFHPASLDVIQGALGSITWPGVGQIDAQIFILPFPRRELLPSSADDGSIYLSPGVYPYTDEASNALVVHEYGHLVHQHLLPDSDTEGWARYRALRGLTDERTYNERAEHRNRPHEIFAEDFRALFGGTLANYSGSIENSDLTPPNLVPGLRHFFLQLLDGTSTEVAPLARLVATPNPFVGSTKLALENPTPGTGGSLEIIDVAGRCLRHLSLDGAGTGFAWDGQDDQGRPQPAGLYFARADLGTEIRIAKIIKAR